MEVCLSCEFSKVSHDETLTRNHSFVAQNALILTYSKIKTKKFSGGITPGPPLQEREGKGKNGRVNEMKGYGPPLFRSSKLAYAYGRRKIF